MAEQLEAWVADQMLDIALIPCEEVVDAEYLIPVAEQPVAKVRPKKSGSPSNEYRLTRNHPKFL